MNVAFLQRMFAHYQWGLVQELALHSEHRYSFFGDIRDPGGSGIEVIPRERLQQVRFTRARTWQVGRRVAFQAAAVRTALNGAYDVLILEGAYAHPTAWSAMNLAQRQGKRVLLYTHGWRRQTEPGWVSRIRTRFMRAADGLLLYGRRAKAIGLSYGIPAERMYVAFNCLDHRRLQACRTAISDAAIAEFRQVTFGNPQFPIVTSAGRLGKDKRLECVLTALAQLKARGTEVGFLAIGGGAGVAALQRMAERLGIRVHFAGPVYDDARLALMLSASRVVVAPEAVGLTAVHAMSFGTPVLTHNDPEEQMPEAEAVVPGVTGELFARGDQTDLTEKLGRFLGPDDPRPFWAPSCLAMVDRFYNPGFMRRVFDRAVAGLPAEETEALPQPVGTEMKNG